MISRCGAKNPAIYQVLTKAQKNLTYTTEGYTKNSRPRCSGPVIITTSIT